MIEPPSKQLLQVLSAQKLCTERDLRRCRKHVRRLSGDLPAFDSVWLDALVQTQKLTAYQASLIESGQHDTLRIGPSIVLDRIGGTTSETFIAKDAASKSLIVVKRMSVPAELKVATLARLQRLIDVTRDIDHPGLIVPHACSELGPSRTQKRKSEQASWVGSRVDLAVACRLVEGLSLGELLLRRGRFPADVVLEIARQTLDQLALLHERDLVHGEIGWHNLRLPKNGQLLVLDPGITPALQPELQINAFVRPDRYDGVAPELIGTGQQRTPQSDFYALGVLLWQLLAGRPPFTTGDPLAKLAAHQMQRIPEVSELAPETPERLTRLISWLTERDPQLRPSSAKVVLSGHPHSIGPVRRSGRALLAQFASSFKQPPARCLQRPTHVFPKVMAAAVASVLLAAGTLIALHGQTRHWVLAELPQLGRQTSTNIEPNAATSEAIETAHHIPAPVVMPLPKPDANGVIELQEHGIYHAEKVIWRGHKLTLRGSKDAPATVRVSGQSLWLRSAFEIICEHVQFESESHELPQLAVFESQELQLQHCAWRSPLALSLPSIGSTNSEAATATDQPSRTIRDAFVWGPHNAQDSLKRKLIVKQTQFLGAYSTIHVGGAGRDHEIEFDNVLKTDGGPLLLLEPHQGRHRATVTVEFNRSTLRACDGAVALKLREGQLDSRLAVTLIDTVLDLDASPSTNDRVRPAVALVGQRLTKDWTQHVSLTAQGSYTSPGLTRFGLVAADGLRSKSLDASAPKTSGLISTGFTFQGDDLLKVADSLLLEFSAPRRSDTFPGIQDGDAS